MSQENMEMFKRGFDAYQRRDIDALLATVDPEVEWYPLLPVLLRGETVYRGHGGVRELVRELDAAFVEFQAELSDIRDLGERVLASGKIRGRGKESGVATESDIVWLVELKDGKGLRIREYLTPNEAFEAVGLRE
jgi:ketosteroid isomerase-like protein